MHDDTPSWIWLGMALLAGIAIALSFGAGGIAVVPVVLCGLALACAVHRPSRHLVMEKGCEALSGRRVRMAVVLVGAILCMYVLPFELALLMAGDVLVYLEVVAAVGLITANTRLASMRAVAAQRFQALTSIVDAVLRRSVRAPRRIRSPGARRPASKDSDGDAGWAFA